MEKIDRARLPEALRDVTGYKFWNEDSQSRHHQAIERPAGIFADQEFFERLEDLVNDMAEVFKRLAQAPLRPGQQPVLAKKEASGPAVFLAHAAPEVDSGRFRLQTYLGQSDLRVVTPESLPFERTAYMAALEREMNKCVVFVQLLGREAVVPAPDDAASDPEVQLATAQRLGKPILQWRDPTLDVSTVQDEKQRALLQANTVEQMGIEEFKQFVAKRALAKPAVTRAPVAIPPARY